MPHQLSKNDVVSVYGQRYGRNDIRYADVIVLRNDNKTENRNNEKFQKFVGRVVDTRPRKSFDLREDDIIYIVTTTVAMPRSLSRNDIVRVYGQRICKSNIYVANVRILRDKIDRDDE